MSSLIRHLMGLNCVSVACGLAQTEILLLLAASASRSTAQQLYYLLYCIVPNLVVPHRRMETKWQSGAYPGRHLLHAKLNVTEQNSRPQLIIFSLFSIL